MSAVQHKPRIEVLRVGEEHAEPLAEFYRAVWSRDAVASGVRAARAAAAAANPVEPGADIPAFAFLSDGKVLGYIGTVPTRFWNGTAEHPAHWFKGFMVLPEFQGGPVGHAVLKLSSRYALAAATSFSLGSRGISSARRRTMSSGLMPSASALKLVMMRWRRTGGATARMSSQET